MWVYINGVGQEVAEGTVLVNVPRFTAGIGQVRGGEIHSLGNPGIRWGGPRLMGRGYIIIRPGDPRMRLIDAWLMRAALEGQYPAYLTHMLNPLLEDTP